MGQANLTAGYGWRAGAAGIAVACAFPVAALLPVTSLAAAAVTNTVDPSAFPDVRRYCTSIAAAATDARFAWQTGKLNELETRVKARIKELDAKEAELRGWIEKREALDRTAAEKLVGIYAKMRPETAATQISALDDDMAASVLGQLNPRQASAIFNEIVPDRAVKLTNMIAGRKPADDKK